MFCSATKTILYVLIIVVHKASGLI